MELGFDKEKRDASQQVAFAGFAGFMCITRTMPFHPGRPGPRMRYVFPSINLRYNRAPPVRLNQPVSLTAPPDSGS
jgi:hypothetical protein